MANDKPTDMNANGTVRPEKRFCENCGTELEEGSAFCTNCGTPVPKDAPAEKEAGAKSAEPKTAADEQPDAPRVRNCENCGAELPEGSAFCTNCGTPVPKDAPAEKEAGVKSAEPKTAADEQPDAPRVRNCENCGAELEEGSAFCTNCGTPVPKDAPVVAAVPVKDEQPEKPREFDQPQEPQKPEEDAAKTEDEPPRVSLQKTGDEAETAPVVAAVPVKDEQTEKPREFDQPQEPQKPEEDAAKTEDEPPRVSLQKTGDEAETAPVIAAAVPEKDEQPGETQSEKQYCENCGAELDADSAFCENCGAPVPKDAPAPAAAAAGRVRVSSPEEIEQTASAPSGKQYCENCGAELDADSVFCENCGTRVSEGTQQQPAAQQRTQQTQTHTAPWDHSAQPLSASDQRTQPAQDQPPKKKSKTWLWILLAVIGALAAVLIVGYVSCTSYWNSLFGGSAQTPAVAEPTAAPEPSATPAPEPTPTPAPEPVKDFTLSHNQVAELAQDVAAPLLLTEWNAVMTYPQTYNPADWQNLPHMDIADFDTKTASGLVSSSYWADYLYNLRDADNYGRDYRQAGNVFGGDSMYDSREYHMPVTVLEDYFADAFGIEEIPEGVRTDSNDFYTLGVFDEDYMIPLSDPDSDIADIIYPQDGAVKDNKITFTGYIDGTSVSGLIESGSWKLPDDAVPWEITLDVEQNEDSPYGCIVTGYQARAVKIEMPAEESSVPDTALEAQYLGTYYNDVNEELDVLSIMQDGSITFTIKDLDNSNYAATITTDGDGYFEGVTWYDYAAKELRFDMHGWVYLDGGEVAIESASAATPNNYSVKWFFRSGAPSSPSSGAASPAGFDANGFVFADSSQRYLTDAELAGLSKEMLGYARNEIFARHGNIFQTQKYIDHYSQYAWYNNLPKVEDVGYPDLNQYEIVNVELIKSYEDLIP